MLEWVIVGGGPHGIHAAASLVAHGFAPSDIVVIDPRDQLGARWSTVISRVGMKALRSPIVHHVGAAPDGLWRFAKPGGFEAFVAPYLQPPAVAFQAHLAHVVQTELAGVTHLRARVEHVEPSATGVRVEGPGISVRARRVVLAIGGMEDVVIPSWAVGSSRIVHVYEDRPRFQPFQGARRVAVIGGGLSAVQLALAHASDHCTVTLLSRRPIRVHQFDSDAGWMGPKRQQPFRRIESYAERRRIIDAARNRGTIPTDVARVLHRRKGASLEAAVGEVVNARDADDGVELELTDGTRRMFDHVVLATGFSRSRPGGAMVDRLLTEHQLPVAPCGYPTPSRGLAWHPRIFVMGPLAELEVGPASRNLVGAREAVRRILRHVIDEDRGVPSRHVA